MIAAGYQYQLSNTDNQHRKPVGVSSPLGCYVTQLLSLLFFYVVAVTVSQIFNLSFYLDVFPVVSAHLWLLAVRLYQQPFLGGGSYSDKCYSDN